MQPLPSTPPATNGQSPAPLEDISALLGQDTNYIAPPAVTDDGQVLPPPDAQPINPGDFDELDEPGEGELPEEAEKPRNRSYFRRQSKQLVNTFDVIQKSLLRGYVYPRTILEPGDKELVNDYRTKLRALGRNTKKLPLPEEGTDLWDALNRYEQLDRSLSELPLSDEEKGDLIAPLADVLEKHQQKALSPEMALVVALAMIMLPRLEPVFPKLFASLK